MSGRCEVCERVARVSDYYLTHITLSVCRPCFSKNFMGEWKWEWKQR